MNKTVKKSIWTTWEGFMHLWTKSHEQRSETKKPISEWAINKTKSTRDGLAKDGMYQITSGHFGGCIGNPINAYEEGRWTSWNTEDMKVMLDEVGLPYKDGEEVEFFSL